MEWRSVNVVTLGAAVSWRRRGRIGDSCGIGCWFFFSSFSLFSCGGRGRGGGETERMVIDVGGDGCRTTIGGDGVVMVDTTAVVDSGSDKNCLFSLASSYGSSSGDGSRASRRRVANSRASRRSPGESRSGSFTNSARSSPSVGERSRGRHGGGGCRSIVTGGCGRNSDVVLLPLMPLLPLAMGSVYDCTNSRRRRDS